MKKTYKLLKNLPHCPAGTVFSWSKYSNTWAENSDRMSARYTFSEETIKDKNWFEPLKDCICPCHTLKMLHGANSEPCCEQPIFGLPTPTPTKDDQAI